MAINRDAKEWLHMTSLGKLSGVSAVGACLFLLLAGCQTTEQRRVHKLVSSKMAEHAGYAHGSERWEDFRKSEYQDTDDITKSRDRIFGERKRQAEAKQLVAAGPLTLVLCEAFSLEFNDEIQAQRQGIRAMGGERLVVKSRFLPQLTYHLEHADRDREGTGPEDTAEVGEGETSDVEVEEDTRDTHHYVRLTQTLAEFGRDKEEDVILRESERRALFEYEDKIRSVLSEVRKKFFTILLRHEQMAVRKKLLEEFRTRYDKMKGLEKARKVLEVDVLTARLNMLNEEKNINSLEREILRQKIDLLHLLGFPVGMTDIKIIGDIETFDLSVHKAVDIALRRSSWVAQTRADVAEQERRVREVRWEYVPTISLQGGWQEDKNVAGVELETQEGLYSVSTFAEAHSDVYSDIFERELGGLEADKKGWFVDLSVELPVFQGLKRKGLYDKEKALLARGRHELRNRIDSVESKVRKAYQTMLERGKDVEILKETVNISRERLRVQERLKELGRISDNELETFRERFFGDQDKFFTQQIYLIEAQEKVRYEMRWFESRSTEGEAESGKEKSKTGGD